MSHAVSVYHGQFCRATLYELDRPMTTHAHREGHLIFFLGDSGGCVQVSGQSVAITTRNAVAVSPWESHGFIPLAPGRSGLFLVLYVSPALLQNSKPAPRDLRFGMPEVILTPEIERAVDRLTNLLATHRTNENIDSRLLELTELCRIQSWWQTADDPARAAAKPEFVDFRVRKSIRLLSDRFADDPDFDGVARESGLSRPHFYKLFKAQVGVTPSVFLNTLRMERAVALVAAAERSITDISESLGFSCQSVFTRFFASHVGVPPSDYRRVARVLHS